MENQIESSSIETLTFLPKDFFNKEVNEKFINFVMESILQDGKWVKGDANKNEPDYLYNGIPLEFTLAYPIPITDAMIESKKYPYIIEKNLYYKLVDKG